MMGEVVEGQFKKTGVSVEEVIKGATNADLDQVIVLGWKKKDRALYAASSSGKYSEILTLIEVTKKIILDNYCGD